ncbi:MAG: PaREP1 family protein [Sulfolobales archaeon]
MSTYIEIPNEIYEILKKISARIGKDPTTLVIESVIKNLDPGNRVEIYLRLHEKYLREAEELVAKEDLVQASEKYWGAVTSILDAIGELRGWDHYSHRDYNIIIENLYEETEDRDLLIDFSMVERLHSNFYHNFMKKSTFEYHREHATRLIEKLKKILTRIMSETNKKVYLPNYSEYDK